MRRLTSEILFILLILAEILIIPLYFPNDCHAAEDISPTSLHARYAALIDADNNRLLYGKESDQAVPMASTTKIMTLIISLEICDDSFVATTSPYAASMPDVQLNATKGEQFTMHDLYYSLILKSHNDVAVIIAENAAYYYLCHCEDKELYASKYDLSFIPDDSPSSEFLKDLSHENSKTLVHIFTDLMNEKASSLGCTSTHFVTPNGLDGADEEGIHSTTAYELAKIMSYCIKNEAFLEICQTKSTSFSDKAGKSFSVSNANAFLSMYDNIIAGKTGFTGDAGYCYVCAYKDGERTFVVALLACGWPNNKTYKWNDSRLLLDYAREHYAPETLITDRKIFDIPIHGGVQQSTQLIIEQDYSAVISPKDNVSVEYHLPSSFDAPIHAGSKCGEVHIYINDTLIQKYDVFWNEDIKKLTFSNYLSNVLKKFLFLAG